ncbi:HNH/ENDO VII family nuclease [Paenibacillus koleovorans]|uniref:HNH/ENDO VII family nuclease n=1 Tax=Paenibacillus koleovorans TaxID=121608 RepID=UPI001FEA4AFB|nr:HNH/ENDO VII family nuclease [Paenibacillus koleovorans]
MYLLLDRIQYRLFQMVVFHRMLRTSLLGLVFVSAAKVITFPLTALRVMALPASGGKPYSNSSNRPKYGTGQVDEVWQNAKDANGKVYDPNAGEELFWDPTKLRAGQWDMGHVPEYKTQ